MKAGKELATALREGMERARFRSVAARRPLLLYPPSMPPELVTAARDFRVTAVLSAPVPLETHVAAVRAAVTLGRAMPVGLDLYG